MNEKFMDVIISTDVNDLYNALHLVHGSYDDSKYARKVCEYYTKQVDSVLTKTGLLDLDGIEINVEINDVDMISLAISNLKQLMKLIKKIDISITDSNKQLDFTKYDVFLPEKIEFVSEEFNIWLKNALDKISVLPKSECYYSKDILKNHLLILTGEQSTEIGVSDESILQLEKYFYLTNNGKNEFVDDLYDYSENRFSKKSDYEQLINIIDDPLVSMYTTSSKEEQLSFANEIAKEFAKSENDITIMSGEVVLEETNKEINNVRERLLLAKQNHRKKSRVSFIFGLLAWAILVGGFVFFTLTQKFNPFFFYTFNTEGVWSNIWKCAVSVIAGIVLIFIVIILFNVKIPIPNIVQILPKGIIVYFLVYAVYLLDFDSVFPDHRLIIPYRIIGTICIAFSLFLTISDNLLLINVQNKTKNVNILPNKKAVKEMKEIENACYRNHLYKEKFNMTYFTNRFISANRGFIFYSTILTLMPLVLFYLFTFTFTYLAIGAVWVLTVFLIIGFAIGGLIFGYGIGNYNRKIQWGY